MKLCPLCGRPARGLSIYCSIDCEFKAKLAQGQAGEDFVAETFRQAGVWVSRTAERISPPGEGPRMRNARGSLVTPDIQLMAYGLSAWLEVKTKTAPIMGRITRELEHGLNLASWENCHAWQRETRDAVFLVCVEEATPHMPQRILLGRWIDHIKIRGDCPTLFDETLMVYFPRRVLYEGLAFVAHVKRYFERRRNRGDHWQDQDS